MGVWARRAVVTTAAVALSTGVFFALTYLMVCEFTKAVE